MLLVSNILFIKSIFGFLKMVQQLFAWLSAQFDNASTVNTRVKFAIYRWHTWREPHKAHELYDEARLGLVSGSC